MKAAYIKDQAFATSSIHFMLCDVFGEANVTPLSLSELRPSSFRGLDFFLLPGIAGEKSPYPRIMSPDKADMIRKKSEDDGMATWWDCAAGYWAKKEIIYTGENGKSKRRLGLGWVDATAKGPRPDKGLPPAKSGSYTDTTTVTVEYYADGNTYQTDIGYGNGAGFYLSDEEMKNPDVEIFARYREPEEQPIAAMTKIMGHGMMASLGVLPQIKPAHLVGRLSNPQEEEHRRDLFNAVSRHEFGIRHFEAALFRKLFEHIQKWPQTSYPEKLYA